MKYNNFIWMLLLLFFSIVTVQGQVDSTKKNKKRKISLKKPVKPTQNCEQQLIEAQNYYDNGFLDSVPKALANLDKCSMIFQGRGYRLLIKTYLLQENDKEAEKYYLKLLHVNPLYKPEETELKDLIFFSQFFRAAPWFAFTFKTGGISTTPHLIQSYGLDNIQLTNVGQTINNIADNSFSSQFNYYIGGEVSVHFIRYFEISGGFFLANRKFTQVNTQQTLGAANGTHTFSFEQLEYIENQEWLDLPISLKFNFGETAGRVVPYVFAGVAPQFLRKAQFLNITRSSVTIENYELNNIRNTIDLDANGNIDNNAIVNLRKKTNTTLFAGAGIKIRIGTNHFRVEVARGTMLQNIVNEQDRYRAHELLYRFGHIDSDVHLVNTYISGGFVYNIYNARKLKRYR